MIAALIGALTLGVAGAAPGAETSGVSVVADGADCSRAQAGSSSPTFYASNHRLVVTGGGRQLAIYDAHDSGQQLAWRDAGGPWRSDSAGYLAEDLANDRTASIALARDGSGRQHAWIVWAGYETVGAGEIQNLALEMRRLTDLDAASGPTIGPEVVVWPAGEGNLRPDIAFEGGRGVIVWVEKAGASSYELKTTTFENLASNSPAFADPVVVATTSNPEMTATLVETSEGVKIVARTDQLRVYSHAADFSAWTEGSDGVSAPADARPSAVGLASGDLLATFDMGAGIEVVRFSPSGNSAQIELGPVAGYKQPSIAANGSDAWIFMVRGDGDVVSRARVSGSWATSDAVEIEGDQQGDDLEWPNLARDVGGWLRLLLDGQRCSDHRYRNWVLSYQRPTGDVPPPPAERPSVSINDVSITETNWDTKSARFTVALSRASADTVSLSYATENGTATAPADYKAKGGALQFAPGVTTKSVSVAVKGERVRERAETFFLRLSGAVNATISDDLGEATIVDNDDARASVTVRVRRRVHRILVRGRVRPLRRRAEVVTTLWRKGRWGYVKVDSKRVPLRARSWSSVYRTRFARPHRGRCRVTTRVPATRRLRAARARQTFRC